MDKKDQMVSEEMIDQSTDRMGLTRSLVLLEKLRMFAVDLSLDDYAEAIETVFNFVDDMAILFNRLEKKE